MTLVNFTLHTFLCLYDLSSPRAECMYDHPKKDMALTRVLPGKILSLDEQCDRIKGTHACNVSHFVNPYTSK